MAIRNKRHKNDKQRHQREDGPPQIRIVTWFLRACGSEDTSTRATDEALTRMNAWAESVTTGPREGTMSITQTTNARTAICTLLASAVSDIELQRSSVRAAGSLLEDVLVVPLNGRLAQVLIRDLESPPSTRTTEEDALCGGNLDPYGILDPALGHVDSQPDDAEIINDPAVEDAYGSAEEDASFTT